MSFQYTQFSLPTMFLSFHFHISQSNFYSIFPSCKEVGKFHIHATHFQVPPLGWYDMFNLQGSTSYPSISPSITIIITIHALLPSQEPITWDDCKRSAPLMPYPYTILSFMKHYSNPTHSHTLLCTFSVGVLEASVRSW